jgi:hypothetical protein
MLGKGLSGHRIIGASKWCRRGGPCGRPDQDEASGYRASDIDAWSGVLACDSNEMPRRLSLRADSDRRDIRQSESALEGARSARAVVRFLRTGAEAQRAIRADGGADSSVASADACDDTSTRRHIGRTARAARSRALAARRRSTVLPARRTGGRMRPSAWLRPSCGATAPGTSYILT